MKRLACVLGVVGLLMVVASTRPAGAEGDETPTVKVVMEKLHKGANSPLGQLKKASQAEKPVWAAVQKTTKDFVILGADLEKNDPPKGEKASWKKFADKYYATAKELDDAAAGKDLEKTKAAVKSLGASCKSCHDAHKEAAKK